MKIKDFLLNVLILFWKKLDNLKIKSKILIIAGSDSSGGAGIQADIKTVTALGSYSMTAITAVTSQNTTGVKSVIAIPPKEIEKQILFSSKDIKPDAIKIGMLNTPEVILTVSRSLNKIKTKKIILDPVMVAKGGFKLISNKAIKRKVIFAEVTNKAKKNKEARWTLNLSIKGEVLRNKKLWAVIIM